MRTLWMSEMTPSKTPVLKPLVLKTFGCEFGEGFCSILQKKSHVQKLSLYTLKVTDQDVEALVYQCDKLMELNLFRSSITG